MRHQRIWGWALAGACAGAVNGLFGAGGGMLLLPLLTILARPEEESLFPMSIAIILPICLTSLLVTTGGRNLPWELAWPYLAGSAIGGILAGLLGKRIPTVWLHRVLGVLILWGGIRYLC